jgi:hypothetical protein
VADGLAAGVLDRLVRVALLKDIKQDDRGRNHVLFRVRIENASPLVLNGLTVTGTRQDATPATLVGIAVSPRKTMTVPATKEAVDRFGFKSGMRVLAADLSGL